MMNLKEHGYILENALVKIYIKSYKQHTTLLCLMNLFNVAKMTFTRKSVLKFSDQGITAKIQKASSGLSCNQKNSAQFSNEASDVCKA